MKENNRATSFIYLITFLTAMSFAFVGYTSSTFLSRFIDENYLGIVYGVSSIISLVILSNISHLLKRFGQLKLMLAVMAIEAGSLFGLAILDSIAKNKTAFYYHDANVVLGVLILSIYYIALTVILRFSLDLYLEKYSTNKETGRARGIFLTLMNLAIAISPFLVGKLIGTNNFGLVYMISALMFIPAFLIVLYKLKDAKDADYRDPPFFSTLGKIWKDKNIFNIFISAFLLEFFYSWMVIYTPYYLNQKIGFSWQEIGTMFSIMLLPFVLFQLPLGKIADKYLGEKEILTTGFLICGLSTLYLYFVTTAAFITWTGVLFLTRVGASAIEIMNETYFFKKVSPQDSDIIGFFRNSSPLAYIFGPLLATGVLYFLDFRSIFLILGLIMIAGIKFSLSIKDTM